MKMYKHGADKIIIEDEIIKEIDIEEIVDWDTMKDSDNKVFYLNCSYSTEDAYTIAISGNKDRDPVKDILVSMGNAMRAFMEQNDVSPTEVSVFLAELNRNCLDAVAPRE